MNRNGKGGTIFIILIPIFILILAFMYDNIMIISNNKLYEQISYDIIETALKNNYQDIEIYIKKEYEDKKLETDNLTVEYVDGTYNIYNDHLYPAFLGRLMGTKTYRTEINVKASINDNGEVLIEKNNEE